MLHAQTPGELAAMVSFHSDGWTAGGSVAVSGADMWVPGGAGDTSLVPVGHPASRPSRETLRF